jgi:hypothetical protein
MTASRIGEKRQSTGDVALSFAYAIEITAQTAKQSYEAAELASNKTFLWEDSSPGFWVALFAYLFQPRVLELRNTDVDGRGVKAWRFTSLPDGGIVNMTYVTTTGESAFCDSRCPLPEHKTSIQTFTFSNTAWMQAFRIDASDWYGSGAGLDGLSLRAVKFADAATTVSDRFSSSSSSLSPSSNAPTPSNSPLATPAPDSGSISAGAIAGITVGSILGFASILAFIILLLRRKKNDVGFGKLSSHSGSEMYQPAGGRHELATKNTQFFEAPEVPTETDNMEVYELHSESTPAQLV